jgi:hypothetical protein
LETIFTLFSQGSRKRKRRKEGREGKKEGGREEGREDWIKKKVIFQLKRADILEGEFQEPKDSPSALRNSLVLLLLGFPYPSLNGRGYLSQSH